MIVHVALGRTLAPPRSAMLKVIDPAGRSSLVKRPGIFGLEDGHLVQTTEAKLRKLMKAMRKTGKTQELELDIIRNLPQVKVLPGTQHESSGCFPSGNNDACQDEDAANEMDNMKGLSQNQESCNSAEDRQRVVHKRGAYRPYNRNGLIPA
jgi:hypothetical protein